MELATYITEGDLDGLGPGTYEGVTDAYLNKYDAAGNLVWIEQLGTSSLDQSLDVMVDGLSNVYITGFTGGDLDGPGSGMFSGGYSDAFLVKYHDPDVVPEPSTLTLAGIGLIGLFGRCRRRRRA